MATERNEENPLRELLGKINHALPDVRSRSMRSVLFKLSTGLISTEELVHERDFLAHLLEWFNFDEWPLESQVLGLLSQLAEHEPAATTLVEIGAVEFLSQLRLHSDPSLHATIDAVLEHLLKLPPNTSQTSSTIITASNASASPVLIHSWLYSSDNHRSPNSNFDASLSPSSGQISQGSSQQTFNTESTTDIGSYLQMSRQSFGGVLDINNTPTTSAPPSLPQQYLDIKTLSPSAPSPSLSQSPVTSWTEASSEGGGLQTQPWLSFPYTASTVVAHAVPSSSFGEENTNGKVKYGAVFPWLRLTVNDRHILTVTENRLQDSTPADMLRLCEFVQEVLFRDFPPQLFIQRPSLINTLLKLLNEDCSGGTHYPVLQCLLQLTARLKQRTGLLSDPAVGIMAESITFPNVDSRMQNHNLSSSSHDQVAGSHDLEQLSCDILRQLQSQQLLPLRYCTTVIDSVAPLLLSYLNKDFLTSQGMESSDGRTLLLCASSCLQLLGGCVKLLQEIVKYCTPLDDDQGSPRPDSCVVSLCTVLCHSVSKWRRLASQPSSSSAQLHTAACVTVHLAHCLSCVLEVSDTCLQFKDKLLPCFHKPDAMTQPSPTISSVLNSIMMSGALAVVCPQLQVKLLPHYDKLDAANSRVFQKVMDFGDAFKKMADFLHLCTESCDHMFAMATAALPGLWFHCNREFVTKAVTVCCHGLAGTVAKCRQWASAKELLLKLLAFGSREVKQLAYSCLEALILESFSKVGAQSSPSGEAASSSVITLLLDRDILAELCCHGAVSESDEVSSSACEILAALLTLALKKDQLWPQLRDAFLQWLPYVEACLCSHEKLCRLYQQFLCSDEGIPELVKLQSHLRLLYAENTELRAWSFTCLTKLLLAGDLKTKLDPFSREVSLPHHDVLIVGKSALNLHCSARKDRTFNVEDVVKLLHIVRSSSMDIALKKTALEQLVLLLKDSQIHGPALEEGISTEVLSLLKTALAKTDTPTGDGGGSSHQDPSATHTSSEVLLRPCLQCLQLLVGCCAELRKELGGDAAFLLDVLRGALLQCFDGELLHSASKLLGILLFNTVSTFSQEDGMSIPHSLLQRLKFPFTVSTSDVNNCHTTPSPLELSLVTSESLLSMLRLHYHVALNGDVKRVIERFEDLSSLEDERLRLQQCDVRSLKSLHMGMSLVDCCNELQEASSHYKVLDLLTHLELLLSAHQSWGGSLNETVDWKQSIQRFLRVQPSTIQDMELLSSVLHCLTTLLEQACPALTTTPQLHWLAEATAGRDSVCILLLQSSLEHAGGKQQQQHSSETQRLLLQKTLLKFYTILMSTLASLSNSSSSTESAVFDPLVLTHTLCHCLEVASSPNCYNLPLLETSIDCLLHVTASGLLKGALIAERQTLSVQLLTSLRQVLWSFISGRGVMLASFMGKGVSSKAALSMAHLLQSTADLKPPESWWSQWLQSSDIGLSWLHCLVQDREQIVQYAGLSLLASLCSKPPVFEVLAADWSSLDPFGLWGVCMQVAVDCERCPLVRQQALCVLVSMSAVCSEQKGWEQHLLYNTDELTLDGQRALEALLTHYNLFELLKVQPTSIAQAKESLAILMEKHFKIASQIRISNTRHKSVAPNIIRLLASSSSKHSSENDNDTVDSKSETASSEGSISDLNLPAFKEGLHALLQGLIESCSPQVVAGVCKLLHNLLLAFPELVGAHMHSHSAVGTLITVLDNEVLAALLLHASTDQPISSRLLASWLTMLTGVVDLLRLAVSLQPDTALPHLLKEDVLASLCGMLTLLQHPGTSKSGYLCVCSAVVSLLQSVVDRSDPHNCELVYSALQHEWNSFSNLLLHSLTLSSPTIPSLRFNCLCLFCSVLAHRFKPSSQGKVAAAAAAHKPGPDELTPHSASDALRELLDGEENKTEEVTSSKDCSSVGGSVLCSALLQVYDSSPVNGVVLEEKQLVGDGLGMLLACSNTAKHTALKAGLLESGVEHVKTLHSNLCMESLEQATQTSKKKKDVPLLNDLIATLSLLRNFLYKSSDIKSAAVGGHLPAVLHKLWPWCTVNKRLCIAVLQLLTTLTAQHQPGRASLASSTNRGSPCLLQSILKHTTHSLTSYESCCYAKLANPHAEVLSASFSLLANCALSTECRAVLKKTGFITSFSNVYPKSEKPARTRLSALWLKLLVNLSFSSEGQQIIIKQPGSVDVLIDVYQCGDSENKKQSLSVLRNLCFYGPSKTLLASNGDFQKVLAAALESGESSQVALAASAIWALLHNCTKIKQCLVKAKLCEKVIQIHSSMQSLELKVTRSATSSDEHCENTLAKVLLLFR